MGCSSSKNIIGSPSSASKKTSSWDKAIHRRFAIQINRSLKVSDGSYIAAIFSSYGVIRKHVPFKVLDTKASLQNTSKKDLHSARTRSMELNSESNHCTNFTAHTVLGVPVACTNSASEMLEAQTTTEKLRRNSETIHVQDLMEGLDEEEVSTSYQASQGSSSQSVKVHKQELLTVVPTNPFEKEHKSPNKRPRPKSFSSFGPVRSVEDIDAALTARRRMTPLHSQSSRTKSFTVMSSIRTTEDVDAVLSARKENTPLSSKSSKEVLVHMEDACEDRCSHLENIYGTILGIDHKLQDGNCDVSVSSYEPEKSSAEGEDPSVPNPESFQKVLSFKYMFERSSGERQTTASSTSTDEPSSAFCKSDSLVFPTAWLLHDGEDNSFPSSPQFSPLSTYSAKAFPEALLSECEEESPVFDPEMVDFFDNAMRQLSKEEWYALRSMEDSPCNLQRSVKTLKKSSSNSLCNRRKRSDLLLFTNMKARIGDKDCLNFESKMEMLSVDKRWAFMRQNSLEIRKAFPQVRGLSDKDRASIVFYSFTLKDGSKAYEDCNRVRSILQSIVGISYDERSISELEEHEIELRYALNMPILLVPTLYVRGKYLVGIESILHLYKKGKLGFMLKESVALGSMTLQCSCEGSPLAVCAVCEDRRKLSRVGKSMLCRQCGGSGVIMCSSKKSEFADGT